MNYLQLETCKLLQEKGCVSESEKNYCGGHTWFHDDQDNGKFEECPYDAVLDDDGYCPSASMTCETFIPAFTWDDICIKENIEKIYRGFEWEPRHYLIFLLDMKLNDEDWEAELVRQLQATTPLEAPESGEKEA